jgi:hypothetical protein
MEGILGTFTGGETKPFTKEDLLRIKKELESFEPPKALVLIPCGASFNMYQVESETAKMIIKMQDLKMQYEKNSYKPPEK